jgi:gluconate kinase
MTNKGVPVCFFITNREYTNVIADWLTWIKESITSRPKRIMIDCSAIKQVFRDEVHILLCHWHIKRAWEKHIKTDVIIFLFVFYLQI